MLQVNDSAVVKVFVEGGKKEFYVSDILTPVSAVERFKTTKTDLCFFGDTLSLLAKAVKENQSFPLVHLLPDNELYRYGRNDGKCFALCLPIDKVKFIKSFV